MPHPPTPSPGVLRPTYTALLAAFEVELSVTEAQLDPSDRIGRKARALADARGAMASLSHALTIAFTCPDASSPRLLGECAAELGRALLELRR